MTVHSTGSARLTNWAGNLTYQARRWHAPATVAELQEVITATPRVRAIGTGHSFNPLGDAGPEGDLVSTAALPPSVEFDPAAMTVTVAAGMRYGDLATRLHAHGYALRNLASLPHISVAGAVATATHGSGVRNPNLAAAVRAARMVTGTGELVELHRSADPETLAGTVVGLGALGVLTHLTLELVPAFEVRQLVYENLPVARLHDHFEEIVASAYSVSVFTGWTGSSVDQVWLKQLVDGAPAGAPEPSWLDATLAGGPRHPVPAMAATACTEQGGVPGPWHTRLPHFRMEFMPSNGEELQSEYFVPREYAVPALAALAGIAERIAPLLQICEIRTIAADDLWLSPAYRRDSVGLHFTWVKDEPGVTALLPEIERRLAEFQPRPHWGKLFTVDPGTLAERYPRLADFRRLRERFDPDRRFGNAFLDHYLG